MQRYKKEWVVSLGLLVAAAVAGLIWGVYPAAPSPASKPIVPGDVAWMLTATALVLLMTPGLSFFYGGMVQRKNVISTMLQSFIAMGVVSLLWVIVGFSLSFGESLGGFVGSPATFFMFRGVGGATHADLAPTIPLALFALFQLKFAIITPALITGSFAERVRFMSYLIFIVLFTIFIYCPVAHWTWHPNGFLRQWGVLDFAGGTVVHMTAGFAALAGAVYLGPRKEHSPGSTHVPANIPFVLLGTGMLWFGWFGFNAGSALAANETAVLAFMTTNTASASAMLGWVLFDAVRGRRPSALGASVGAVVGLVAITPAAGFVSVGQSIAFGLIASVVSNLAVHRKSRTKLDDTLDVFPCHGVGGIVGMILTGVFADKVGLIHGGSALFIRHLLAILLVGAYSLLGSWLIYALTNAIITIRVRPEQEQAGLDLAQHAESYVA
ncbi:MAG: ammonium transporter [Elusimicrobiota bacterium]|nr:MAG: ammonium transporter [Elusimicrobiota bacterium]